jgi:hypothetical protein
MVAQTRFGKKKHFLGVVRVKKTKKSLVPSHIRASKNVFFTPAKKIFPFSQNLVGT